MIEWYSQQHWVVKIICIVFLPITFIAYFLFKNKTTEVVPHWNDMLEGLESGFTYNIEVAEENKVKIEEAIVDNENKEQSIHDKIDTADSFDAVYKSVTCK